MGCDVEMLAGDREVDGVVEVRPGDCARGGGLGTEKSVNWWRRREYEGLSGRSVVECIVAGKQFRSITRERTEGK